MQFLVLAVRSLNRSYYNSHLWTPALVAAGMLAEPEPGQRYDPSRDKGFHQLRHYYASVLLSEGVDIHALAAFLGHEDPGFTLRVYSHLMPASEDRARKAVDVALGLSVVTLRVPGYIMTIKHAGHSDAIPVLGQPWRPARHRSNVAELPDTAR